MFKFPEGKDDHWELLLQYIPVWPGHPLTALLALALSPAAGILWYSPTVLLAWTGLRAVVSAERRVVLALGVAVAIFGAFIVSMSIFKGDPAWGPRYFTPIFAVLWLWAPAGAKRLRRPVVAVILTLGLVVQVLALAVDPHRLYIERGLPSAFGAVAPLLYFDPANAHLLQRPREIVEVWRARADAGTAFSPAPAPTYAFPIIDRVERGPAAIQRYKVLNTFRPWWVSHWYIPPAQRPVSIGAVLVVLLALGGTALGLIWTGLRMAAPS
jgi:hypothetical protein